MSTKSPTSNPTSNPTIYPENEWMFPILVGVYAFVCLFLIWIGATIYTASAHRKIHFNKKKKLTEDLNTLKDDTKLSKEEKAAKLAILQKQFEDLQKPDVYKDLGDNITSITDSKISRVANNIIFHTNVGRVIVNAEKRIEESILRILEYVISLNAQSIFTYYVSHSVFKSQSLTSTFTALFVIYVLFHLMCVMKEEYVRSRMGGTMSILEPQED